MCNTESVIPVDLISSMVENPIYSTQNFLPVVNLPSEIEVTAIVISVVLSASKEHAIDSLAVATLSFLKCSSVVHQHPAFAHILLTR